MTDAFGGVSYNMLAEQIANNTIYRTMRHGLLSNAGV